VPEPTDARYPFALLTGRGSSSQWHTQTRTAKSAMLRKLYPSQPYVEINPGDARALGLTPNEWLVVESRRGAMRARAHPTYVVQPGQLFIPMHYVDTNLLTLAIFDPYSRQPAYKHCAVRVRRDSDPPA
jgi:anaerobic selenocysteine-containing dehydrogenase